MGKYKLETSIQFPFFKINELVSYTEVKKPSGIAYMLLVLLSQSRDQSMKISSLLENYGIPRSLHHLFSDVISNLIQNGFLEMSSGLQFRMGDFNDYELKDIEFTSKGKKVFAEKSIPTGVTKEAKIPVFFNIALNKLSLSMDSSQEPKPLMDSPITPEFMERFRCEKDIEGFLNLNKGTRIPIYENGKVTKTELIKKEEIITSIESLDQENWVGKYDCTITLDGDDCALNFDNKALLDFVIQNYTNGMINRLIAIKSKFKFSSAFAESLKMSKFGNKNIVGVLIPKDLELLKKQKWDLFLTRGNYLPGNCSIVITNDDCLDKLNNSYEFIAVDQSGNKFGYVPGIFDFESKELKAISIPLVLKIKLNDDELKTSLVPYILSLGEYSEENFRKLVSVTSVSKDYENAFRIMQGYLSDDVERNIVLLNEMKTTALLNQNILTKYKDLLKQNFMRYLSLMNEDNMETVLKLSNSIPRFLGLYEKDVLPKAFGYIGNVKDKVKTYEVFVDKGYDKKLVLLYANPIEDIINGTEAHEESLVEFSNFVKKLSYLKKLSGIERLDDYSIDMEGIDKLEFQKTYRTAASLLDKVNVFRGQNESRFKEYDSFMKLFCGINDEFNMTDSALSNPKAVKEETILKKIDSGEYQFVFVNLSAKLETILKEKYTLTGKLSEMLSKARAKGLISKSVVNDLHDFREARNSCVHAVENAIKFESDDLRRWCEEIFQLGGEKDEPSSNR